MNEQIVTTRTIAQVSAETVALIRRMAEMNIGDTITYADMNKIISGNVQGKQRHCIETARKHLMNDKQMVFETIPKIGVIRVSDSKIVSNSSGSINRIGRSAKRAMAKLACADYNKLDQGEKMKHNTNAAMLGTLRFMTQASSIKKLETNTVVASKIPDISDTLKAFGMKE